MESEKSRLHRIAPYLVAAAALCALELVPALYYRQMPFFWKGAEGDFSERSTKLFSALDPLLGYAHDPDFVPSAKDTKMLVGLPPGLEQLRNGFVLAKHLVPGQRPLKIAVLGSSSSDPYLFDGNWPYFLHELLRERNRAHLIYNGAVSGYNSTQTLLKLQRDLFALDSLDLVIFYHGGNDFPGNDDVLSGYPSVHPYQRYLLESLGAGNGASRQWPLLPNALRMLSGAGRMLFSSGKALQLGVPSTDHRGRFVRNVEYMEAASRLNGVKFVHVLEVYREREDQAVLSANPFVEPAEIGTGVREFLTNLRQDLKALPYSLSIQQEFPASARVFFDSVHLNDEGNRTLASLLLDALSRKGAL